MPVPSSPPTTGDPPPSSARRSRPSAPGRCASRSASTRSTPTALLEHADLLVTSPSVSSRFPDDRSVAARGARRSRGARRPGPQRGRPLHAPHRRATGGRDRHEGQDDDRVAPGGDAGRGRPPDRPGREHRHAAGRAVARARAGRLGRARALRAAAADDQPRRRRRPVHEHRRGPPGPPRHRRGVPGSQGAPCGADRAGRTGRAQPRRRRLPRARGAAATRGAGVVRHGPAGSRGAGGLARGRLADGRWRAGRLRRGGAPARSPHARRRARAPRSRRV